MNPYWKEVGNPGFWILPSLVEYYAEQIAKGLKGGGEGA